MMKQDPVNMNCYSTKPPGKGLVFELLPLIKTRRNATYNVIVFVTYTDKGKLEPKSLMVC